MAQLNDVIISSLRGGLNDTDPPQDLANDECVQADNVEFFNSACGERRKGTASLSLTSSGLTSEAGIAHLSQWFPTNVVTLPEYIAIGATPGSTVSAARRDTGGTWHTMSPNDAINTSVPDVFGIVTQPLDANLHIGYHSAQDRSHIWDSTSWRRAGLAQPSAPTVANTGSANFTGKRYYRVRYTIMSGSTIVVRSEPSASTAFTPSGTGSAARITKPASISENETHWELEASEDDANYYRLATTVVGTTTYDDSVASSKSFPAPRGAGAPVSNDGSSITYVLLSDQAAALNLTGSVSNGSYGNPGATISGRGWIGYTSGDVYIPAFPATWVLGQKYYASPDVATDLEAGSSGDSANYAAVGTLSDAIGAYLPLPAAKFFTVDQDRLVYGGHWTDAARQSTVGWTPVRNDPGVGNSERAPIVTTGGDDITTYVNLDNYDGGPLTGLASSHLGTWYAFKWQRIYGAVRTRDVTQAYDIDTVSTSKGAVPGSVVRAADSTGAGAIFFLDPFVGPCKLGPGGVINVIRGLRSTWARVNLKATSVVCCGAFYPYKQQVKWWISVDGGNTPTLGITLQVSDLKIRPDGDLTGCISLTTGTAGNARCAAALTFTNGNITTDIPFIGTASPDFVQRLDTGTADNGTTFTATIKSKPLFLAGLLNKWRVRKTTILATADANASVRVGLIRDEGVETILVDTIDLSPSGSEVQVVKDFDDLLISELRSVQVELTDGTPVKDWQVQRIDLKPTPEERG